MKKEKMLAIFFILATLTICYLLFQRHDPWKDIGINSGRRFEDIIDVYGEPERIQITDSGAYVIYRNVDFYFINPKLTGVFVNTIIKDDTIKLGAFNIKVGDDINKVRQIYKIFYRYYHKDDEKDGEVTYWHDLTHITYFYKENKIYEINVYDW